MKNPQLYSRFHQLQTNPIVEKSKEILLVILEGNYMIENL